MFGQFMIETEFIDAFQQPRPKSLMHFECTIYNIFRNSLFSFRKRWMRRFIIHSSLCPFVPWCLCGEMR